MGRVQVSRNNDLQSKVVGTARSCHEKASTRTFVVGTRSSSRDGLRYDLCSGLLQYPATNRSLRNPFAGPCRCRRQCFDDRQSHVSRDLLVKLHPGSPYLDLHSAVILRSSARYVRTIPKKTLITYVLSARRLIWSFFVQVTPPHQQWRPSGCCAPSPESLLQPIETGSKP